MLEISYLQDSLKFLLYQFIALIATLLSFSPIQSSPSPSPSATSFPEPNFAHPFPTATPTPDVNTNLYLSPLNQPPKTSVPNFQIEPDPSGEAGLYLMKTTLIEPMTTASELNQAVNQYRSAHNFSQLSIDPQLCQIANQRVQEISQHFSHDEFSRHVAAGDYNYTGFNQIGENLWHGSFSGVHIVEFGWDRTEGHRANLQGDWTRGCAGVLNDYAVFIFAK